MKYSIIYIDPPWLYNKRKNPKTKFGLGMHRYPGMTCKEICDLQIANLMDENCAVFIWTVPPKLKQLFPILDAWGLRYCTKAFSWVKLDKKGNARLLPGYYTGSNTEDCYLAMKGRLPVIDKGVRQVVFSELTKHSSKPSEVRDRIVRLFGDLPRLEVFAREHVAGWDAIGYDIDGKDIRESLIDLQLKEAV